MWRCCVAIKRKESALKAETCCVCEENEYTYGTQLICKTKIYRVVFNGYLYIYICKEAKNI